MLSLQQSQPGTDVIQWLYLIVCIHYFLQARSEDDALFVYERLGCEIEVIASACPNKTATSKKWPPTDRIIITSNETG